MNPLTIIGSFLALLVTAVTIMVLLGGIQSRRRQIEWLLLHDLAASKRSVATTTIGQAQDARKGLSDVRGPGAQDTGVGQIPPVRDNEDGQP